MSGPALALCLLGDGESSEMAEWEEERLMGGVRTGLGGVDSAEEISITSYVKEGVLVETDLDFTKPGVENEGRAPRLFLRTKRSDWGYQRAMIEIKD